MHIARTFRFCPLALGLLSTALAVLPGRAQAGELSLAWSASGPAASTTYRVFVGERPGQYDRTVDAGTALRTTINDLPDGEILYFAVKAFDAAGNESPGFSAELACMARPRLTSIESAPLHAGGSAWITLRGANFDRDVQIRSNDARLHARTIVLEPDGRLSVLVEADAGDGSDVTPQVSTFTLLNPCQRAEVFFEAHPRAADLDDSGVVDEKDVRAVSAAIGSRLGESHYAAAADLDGDGVVDGRDLARAVALVGASSKTATADAPAAPSSATLSR